MTAITVSRRRFWQGQVVVGFAIGALACGPTPTPKFKVGLERGFSLERPLLKNTTEYVFHPGAFPGSGHFHGMAFRLPQADQTSILPYFFVSPHQAYLTVLPLPLGPTRRAVSEMLRIRNSGGSFRAAGWIGVTHQLEIRDGKRSGCEIKLYNSKTAYSVMVSWPEGDPLAKQEAEQMGRDVLWSYKELSEDNEQDRKADQHDSSPPKRAKNGG
jgi:hypothetical protein